MEEPKAIKRTGNAGVTTPADLSQSDDVRLYENPDGTVVKLLRDGEVIVTLEVTAMTSDSSR